MKGKTSIAFEFHSFIANLHVTVAEANVYLASRIPTTASVTGLIMINDDDDGDNDGDDDVDNRTTILCLQLRV